MAKSILTTLTAYDYKDLKQTYSEKNIINQTNGNEYVIDVATTQQITDINDKSQEIAISPLNMSYSLSAQYMEVCIRGIFAKQYIQGRDEAISNYISLSIETDEIITDTNNISVGLTIYYNKYHADGDYINGTNMSSRKPVYNQIYKSQYKTNDSLLTATEKLPYSHSELVGRNIAWTDRWNSGENLDMTPPANRLNVKCQKLSNDHFKITVSGWVCTWWGYNYSKADKWGQRGNNATLLAAEKIGLTISANTVEAREIEFVYSRDDELDYGNAIGKNYLIESNEFMQTDENLGETYRQSYKTSKQIFDAYDQDRTIVSFTLLNCEKYNVNGKYRYLQAEDLIYIKDENDEYISDELNANGEQIASVFEVIKTRPVWDGSFSMEVTCRKIDMTT